MFKFIVKRILMIIPVIVGISFIVFSIMSLTPGDPARLILGESASLDEVNELREEMGFNDNFILKYVRYVKNIVLYGDFGVSYISRQPVFNEVFTRFPSTIKLAFGATIFMVLIGIPIGIISAVKQYSLADTLSLLGALMLASMPGFFLGLLLILILGLYLGLLPVTGVASLKNYIMPCIALGASQMAQLLRMTRSNMLEVNKQDYIRTAMSKGAGEKRIIIKHALRNALLPIVTTIGLSFGTMLGGTMVIENLFAMPGLGSLTITSVRMKDTPVVMASILFIAIMLSLINLLIDILYTFIDPRLKSQFSKN